MIVNIMIRYAKSVGAEHIGTSAKTGLGVSEIFTSLATGKYYTY